jgi:ribulose-phosphate 3-epimerase
MIEIIPAILTGSTEELAEMLSKCEGNVGRVQIDVIDGLFADNKTIRPRDVANLDTKLLIDYHLMVDEPVNWIDECVTGYADRIIGQVEKMSNQIGFVGKVTEVGRKVGLAIDIDTPVSKLDPVILNNLDVVLVMSVKAGFGGQEFDDSVLTKIDQLDEIRSRDDTPFRICDDGGITYDNIDDIRIQGVNEASIGKRLFKGDLNDNILKNKRAAYGR